MSTSDKETNETKEKKMTTDTTPASGDESEERKTTGKVDVLLADVFHVGDGDVERIPWGKLDVETRVQKLKEYFEREFNHEGTEKTITKTTIDMLLEMVEKKQLHLKKEVSYDEINQRVIKLHVLTPEPHTDHYVYKPEKMSRREKSRKSAKTRLFRKKR